MSRNTVLIPALSLIIGIAIGFFASNSAGAGYVSLQKGEPVDAYYAALQRCMSKGADWYFDQNHNPNDPSTWKCINHAAVKNSATK